MFRSKFVLVALSAVCLLGSQAIAPTLAVASPLHVNVPVHAIFGKKMVSVNLNNNTGSSLEVKVGDTPMTIEAGKTVTVKAVVGTRITLATTTGTRTAGTVLAELSGELSGATIHIN